MLGNELDGPFYLVYAMGNVARGGFDAFYTSEKRFGLQKVNLGSKKGQFW